MPAAKSSSEPAAHVTLPCDGDPAFKGLSGFLPACINCRREVEASLTRVAGRKLRKLRLLPECSVARCAEFLSSVSDNSLRLHLSSMAWWRFSAENDSGAAEPVRRIMADCPPFPPEFGKDYLHLAMKELSRLNQAQISAWFGCDDVYHIAALFSGDRPERTGPHCQKCRLYKLGCTYHGMLGSESCPLWEDQFVQGVAAAVSRSGGWNDPCRGVQDAEKQK